MLKDSFCSSPWFHFRIKPNGDFISCRWAPKNILSNHNISNTGLYEYFNSEEMNELRTSFLEGNQPDICRVCYYEDQHNKINGRQLSLHRSLINYDNFEKSFCSSPHYSLFEYSHNNQGHTNYHPVDLQIDLGNTCNNACIMCSPMYSSRLADDYKKLNTINPSVFNEQTSYTNWADNDELLEKFVNELTTIPNVSYLHFMGGETLYLKGFYKICHALIKSGISKNISIGITTNGTIYTQEFEDIIANFKSVQIGLSVEVIHSLNDYIRWPSTIDNVVKNLNKFIKLKEKGNIQHLTLRITPSILSIFHLDTIFRFMLDNNITSENSNILWKPSCLRVELLPQNLVNQILDKFNKVIDDYNLIKVNSVVNRRNDNLIDDVISNVIFEFKEFLETFTAPNDVESERYKLVQFIRGFEQLRNNKILDYLPEYEEFLRSYGY